LPKVGYLLKRDEYDVAEALLAKASGDEAGLRALLDHPDVPDHVPGFLAQQVIEKALKAVLTARGVPFERSHDIDYLCSLIEESGLRLTSELRGGIALTPWAVEFRYADPFDATPLNRAEALATVAAVREWAADTITATRPAPIQSGTADEPLDVTVDRGAPDEEMRALALMFERVGINATIRDDHLRLSAETLPYAVMFVGAVTWLAGAFAGGALAKAGADTWDAYRNEGWHGLRDFLVEVGRIRGPNGTVTLRDPTGPDVQLDQGIPDDALRELADLAWDEMNGGRLGWSGDHWLYLEGGAAEAVPAPRRHPVADD
jgi:hypothetical protein